jgi:glycosyltransferase involved in cell wall biosynthesis
VGSWQGIRRGEARGRQLRVGLISNSAFGEQASRLRWAILLRERGYDMRFVLPEGDDLAVRDIEAAGIPVERYPLIRLSPGPASSVRTVAALRQLFARCRFDIVHTFHHEPNLYGALAARLASVPVLITQVTGLGRLFADGQVRHRLTLAQRSLVAAYRVATRLATAVVFHNPDDARVLSYAASKSICLRSGSGVNTTEYAPQTVTPAEQELLRRRLGIPAEAVVITNVSRLVRHKGIQPFLSAAALVTGRRPRARVLIAGGTDAGNSRALRIDELKSTTSDAITLLGERNDVRQLLAISDIFVNASFREGLPRSTLEAMAMGKPIVAFAVPGSRETVDHGVNGLLTPAGDVAALASAIESLVADAGVRARMGAASRERALARFRVEQSVERIERLYRECWAASGGSARADRLQPGGAPGNGAAAPLTAPAPPTSAGG